MSDQTFERAALDGKDREQLQTIASALGVKGVSRMRKADLVDAIVTSAAPAQAPKARSRAKADADAGSGNGAAGSNAAGEKRSIRSARASELDTISRIAAEEDAIARAGGDGATDDDTLPIMRPRRGGGDAAAVVTQPAPTAAPVTAPMSSPTGDVESNGNGHGNGNGDGSAQPGQSTQAGAPAGGESWQEGDGRRSRRNRRRGRNRDVREPQTDVDATQYQGELVEIAGLLDLRDEGYGFLRSTGYLPGRNDAYVSASQVRRFGLRKGDYVKGATRPAVEQREVPGARARRPVNDHDAREPRAAGRASRTSRRCSPIRSSGSSSPRAIGRAHRTHHRPRRTDRQRPARA